MTSWRTWRTPSTQPPSWSRSARIGGRPPIRVSHPRAIAPPFVVTPPAGARVRTQLRATPSEEGVLLAVGRIIDGGRAFVRTRSHRS